MSIKSEFQIDKWIYRINIPCENNSYLGEGESPEDPQDKEGDGEANNKELEDGLGNEDSQPSEHLQQEIKKVESDDEKEMI